MTKQEIEMKREYLIANVSEQINQIRNILYILVIYQKLLIMLMLIFLLMKCFIE